MGKAKSKGGMGAIKRFVGNKNTVTILGFLACIATLVIGYNYRVNQESPSTTVPYAKFDIPTRTLITSEMVGKIKVTSTYVSNSSNLVKNSAEVINRYVSFKTSIPKGSLFYKDQLKEADAMPDAAFSNIEDGYTIYSLAVNEESTYANSIRAGDYIDLYMSATDVDNDNLVIYGKLIESIRVLAVKDRKGNNIIKNSLSYGKPNELLFAVDDDMFLLLKQSEYVSGKVQIEPVIRNAKYTADEGETLVSSQQLREFIEQDVEVLQ